MSSPVSDLATNVVTVIRHSVDAVWPHMLHQAAWMNEFTITTVSGVKDQEGELKRVCALPQQPPFQPFFFKTLFLVPFRKVIYKAYSAQRSGDYWFSGIEVLSLGDMGKETTISFEAYLEFQSAAMMTEQLQEFVARGREASIAMWQRNFVRLSALIDNTRRERES